MTAPAFPPLGLGCAKMGSFNNPSTLADSVALIQLALDLGVTLLDTADIYGQGDSERAIGRALRGQRHRAQVVTKAGNAFSAKMRVLRPLKPLIRAVLARRAMGAAVTAQRGGAMRTDWSRAGLLRALDGSLRRLRSDHVDAFLLHSPDAATIARGEAVGALAEAKRSGRARLVGIACDDTASLDAALASEVTEVLELPWDVIAAIDDARGAAIRARGIPVIAREVLRFQPGTDAAAAVRRAHATPLVTTTLIGSRQPERVRALAAAIGDHPQGTEA
ncbi:aldo/keto reductase [Sphingomonas yunnanensis]|uniref:aldo/keto reductase n=1 Tax=Sphingomonas yunnanensis TaxID=310400 RepID=UPI001CA722D3|nr:aldo/keto reductase [Sphingomonas yunnanensis]MBY9064140.1 aldo/keto reductase [Sphingomonas yunnanensis]